MIGQRPFGGDQVAVEALGGALENTCAEDASVSIEVVPRARPVFCQERSATASPE